MRYGIGDTETTGLKGARACEIGLIEFDPMTLQPIAQWESLIDPEKPIEPGAQAIHGITNEMVADAPTMKEYREIVIPGQLDGEWCIVGYNVQFDKPMLIELMDIKKTYCMLGECRRLFPTQTNDHKLGTMVEYLKLPGGTAHRAMGDCQSVLQMMQLLIPQSGKTFLDLLQVPARTVYVMPWGEHKGKLLADVPKERRTYYLSFPNLDEDLRRSLMQLRAAGI
jgi:DNA polymerase III subunit epsilon